MSYIYDTLLWKDASGELLPWLARDFASSEDGLVYTFNLRDDIRWQDGVPLTAEDVTFTFEYFASQQLTPQIIVRPEGISEVWATGTHSVEVRLVRPAVTFVREIAGALPIVPRHIWSSIDNASSAQDPEILVGSGPYRLEEYAPGEGSYLFSANDEYFLGAPFVRRIENIPVGDELTALLAGELDAGGPPEQSARPEALAPFRADPSFEVIEGPGDFTFGLYWNLGRGGALADIQFRRACALAIDRGELVERLLGGNGQPGNPGFLPPSHPFFADVEQYPFDLDAANTLLDQAGYPRGDGGVRQSGDGQPLKFALLVGNAPVPPATELVVRSLAAIGVEITPQAVDRPTRDQRTSQGDYEMAVTNYGGLGGDPDYMREVYSSELAKRFQGAQGYVNPQFDELARRQLVTPDEAERKVVLAQMQQIVADDLPLLHLYYPTFFHVFREEVFDQWYFTPGGFARRVPTVYNKHAFITGERTGLEIRPTS